MRKLWLWVLAGVIGLLNAGSVMAQGGFEHVHALAMDADGRYLFLGARTGLFRSEDGGRAWKKLALPASDSRLEVTAVTPGPKDPGTIYVATREAGVLGSGNGRRLDPEEHGRRNDVESAEVKSI